MNLNLSEFFIHMITKKNFYGRLASSLERRLKKGLGTLAVGIRDGRAILYYDNSFLEDLSLDAGAFALEHEMLHLVLDHIPRYLELLAVQPTREARVKAATVYNIAMDCAINTMLRGHEGFNAIEEHLKKKARASHEAACERAKEAAEKAGKEFTAPPFDEEKAGMCLPEKFDLPLEGSFESYQYLLMQKVKVQSITINFTGNSHDFWTKADGQGQGKGQGKGQGSKPGKGQGQGKGQGKGNQPGEGEGDGEGEGEGGGGGFTFDISSMGEMSTEEMMQAAHEIRESIKETLRETVRSCGGVGRGILPGNLEEWLEEYLAPPIVPWWEIFATRARMSRASKIKRTVQTPNRALLALAEEDVQIIPSPGRTRDRSWRIFLMVDTSGSMSSDSLEIVQSELHHMLQADESMELRYMQGDSAVHFDVVLKTGDDIPGQMVGRGGTDFDAYFVHMRQYLDDSAKAPDLVVVYTDGYAPPVHVDNRLPIDIPVIWLVTPEHSADFAEGYGEVIVCDPEHNDRHSSRKK